MPRQPSGKSTVRKVYSARASALRAAGFNVSYRSRGSTAHQRAAVSRLWNQHGRRVEGYQDSKRTTFVFREVKSKAARQKVARLVSSAQMTPRGVFIPVPKGTPKSKVQVKVDRGGVTFKGSRREDRIIRLDSRAMSRDPKAAILAAVKEATDRQRIGKGRKGKKGRYKKGKQPRSVSIMVNGFQGRKEIPIKALWYYLDDFLDDLVDDDGEPLSGKQLADIFSLQLIYAK